MTNQDNKVARKENQESPGNKLKDMKESDLNDREFKAAAQKKASEAPENSERQFSELRDKNQPTKEYFPEDHERQPSGVLELKSSINDVKDELESFGNRAD